MNFMLCELLMKRFDTKNTYHIIPFTSNSRTLLFNTTFCVDGNVNCSFFNGKIIIFR